MCALMVCMANCLATKEVDGLEAVWNKLLFFIYVIGFCKIPWQNATMHCIITVYALGITPSTSPELD